MNLSELQQYWNQLGESDPLWAVLTFAGKKGGRWDPDTFFQTGELEIQHVFSRVRVLLNDWTPHGEALDFGCGAGRLTRALGKHFDRCYGVDIAKSMVETAAELAGEGSNCVFRVNDCPDLSIFTSHHFQMIYSALVLQHIEPSYSKKYIQEFIRLLAPGGALVFQVLCDAQGGSKPLAPLEEFRAEILSVTPAGSSTSEGLELATGEHFAFLVRVRNASSVAWPGGGSMGHPEYKIQVGNHWLNADSSVAANDDGRAPLPKDVDPGEEIEVLLGARARDVPGDYFVEVDLVQEHCAWFASRGSATARVPVRVVPYADSGKSSHSDMEIHAIPEQEVIALVTSTGARVLAIEYDDRNVPGFRSCRFYVTS